MDAEADAALEYLTKTDEERAADEAHLLWYQTYIAFKHQQTIIDLRRETPRDRRQHLPINPTDRN